MALLYELQRCDLRYDFRIKAILGSPLPPVICRRTHLRYLCLFGYSSVLHAFFCLSSSCDLYAQCCQFL
jgi:hypothetical protein